MSIKIIEQEIRKSLATDQAEVLCISGDWGVGKTFAWNRYLKLSKDAKQIALGHYAYVSLFGLTTLDELKFSIFENTIGSDAIGMKPSLETIQTNTIEVAKQFAKKVMPVLQHLPYAKNTVGGVATALSLMAVKNSIICIDDVERRGEKLSIRDVLGLVSNMVEQRGCKVVLILNDNAEDKEKDQYKKYFEKVIDKQFRFAPTPSECVEIALPNGTQTERYLKECCTALGISNIRVLRKILKFVQNVEVLLKDHPFGVLKQAVQTIALMSWIVYDPENAPPIDFLEREPFLSTQSSEGKKLLSEQELGWKALLRDYNFSNVDAFDRILLDGIRNGYFSQETLLPLAKLVERKVRAEESNQAYREAWEFYHASLDDNGDAVAQKLFDAFMENAKFVDAPNMNGLVALLKELDKPDQAQLVIDRFIESREDLKSEFDLDNSMFGDMVTDSDARNAIKEKFLSIQDNRDLADVLTSMTQGWNDEDINLLASVDEAKFYELFKTCSSNVRSRVISNSLMFLRIANASDRQKDISRVALKALKKISAESKINSIRLRRYGFIDTESAEASSENATTEA